MRKIDHLIRAARLLVILSIPNLSIANDGDFDADNDFPAVGRIAAVTTVFGQARFAGAYCSGSLIAEDVFSRQATANFLIHPGWPRFQVMLWNTG